MNYERMEEQLVLHEGLRLRPYLDTEGFWTTGVGYNLSSRGVETIEKIIGRKFKLSTVTVHHKDEDVENPFEGLTLEPAEALAVLRVDIKRYEQATRVAWPHYDQLDAIRQRVVLDMAFNMGYGALSFVNTRKFIEQRNWSMAVRNLFQSKWAHQVDDGEGKKFGRADRLAGMLLTGKDYV